MIANGKIEREQEPGLTRRQLLKWTMLAAAAAGLTPARQAAAVVAHAAAPPRKLSFYNINTGEHGVVVYWRNGRYLKKGLRHADYILRDFRTGDIARIEPRLLDLLHRITTEAGTSEPLHIISGYRSPETNAVLRARRAGIAKYSLHMSGKAVDFRLPGLSTSRLQRLAMGLKKGGVGYYPKSGFIHVDVGPVRFW